MSVVILILLAITFFVAVVTLVNKKSKGIMREGKLLKSEIVYQDGEKLYIERVGFKDWHVCIHSYYLIFDRLSEGHTVVDQRWSYDDFCNVTICLDDYTYLLVRQVDAIAFVRSFRPIAVNEFDRMAMSLIM